MNSEGYRPRGEQPTSTALDIAQFLSTLPGDGVHVLISDVSNQTQDGETDVTDEPVPYQIGTIKDRLTLAHSINTCPVGKHITVRFRSEEAREGFITGFHGTSWQNFQQIMKANGQMKPTLGSGWRRLESQFNVRVPLVYFSPVFNESIGQ